MKQIKGLYKLARPFNAFSGALAVFLGGYVAGTGEWLNVTLAAVVAFLVTGAGNSWNDYLDIEIDKINQPHRALPAGFVSPRAAVLLSLLLTATAALALRPGVVKSRNALMDAAYDDQVYVDDRTIDSHIKRLRKKFKAVDDDFEMIETLYGVGYRFKEQ